MINPKDIVILDTHVWIWLLTGGKKLENSGCLAHIENAAKYGNIRVSAISVWEVGMLEAKGRIKFPVECIDWINKALSVPGVSLVPLTPEIAVESSQLPDKFHGDPADRIIVASARKLGATLITHDKEIISYGRKMFVKVIPV
ncbi:MAG: type II toxin-antitoxin system VapC family toxin [bacterium]